MTITIGIIIKPETLNSTKWTQPKTAIIQGNINYGNASDKGRSLIVSWLLPGSQIIAITA